MPVIPHMSYLAAILLGLLQGLTEFLPVSSTAHMDIIPQFFSYPDPGAAFSAIIWYFRNDLLKYWYGVCRCPNPTRIPADDLDARLGWYTILGSLPIFVFGFLLESNIDHKFRELSVVAPALIILGIILALAEFVGRRKKGLGSMTFKDSQAIGWAQVFALVPGASRSGVTITAGLFMGLRREAAARFSFLLSIPSITAAGFYKFIKVVHAHDPALHANLGAYLVAALVAGLFAYIVVTWFLGFMKDHNTAIFIAYRIILGIVVLVLLHTGFLVNRPSKDDAAPVKTTARAEVHVVRFEPNDDGHYMPVSSAH